MGRHARFALAHAAWPIRDGIFSLIVGISYFQVWDPFLRFPINMEGMGLPLKQLTLADVRTESQDSVGFKTSTVTLLLVSQAV